MERERERQVYQSLPISISHSLSPSSSSPLSVSVCSVISVVKSVTPVPRRLMAERLKLPCLALITDRRLAAGRPLETIVRAAIDGGVDLVQLREKDLPAGELYELARRLKAAVGDRALLVVN